MPKRISDLDLASADDVQSGLLMVIDQNGDEKKLPVSAFSDAVQKSLISLSVSETEDRTPLITGNLRNAGGTASGVTITFTSGTVTLGTATTDSNGDFSFQVATDLNPNSVIRATATISLDDTMQILSDVVSLAVLSLTNYTFKASDPPGKVIGEFVDDSEFSALDLSDGRLVRHGRAVCVGKTKATPGTFSADVVETLAGPSNSPLTTSIEFTVEAPSYVVRANDMLRLPPGTVPANLISVAGDVSSTRFYAKALLNGASYCINEMGAVFFNPRDCADHLDPGETLTATLVFNDEEPTIGSNFWAPFSTVAQTGWTANGDGSYTRVAASSSNLIMHSNGFVAGNTVRITYTVSNWNLVGSCAMTWALPGVNTAGAQIHDTDAAMGANATVTMVVDVVVPSGVDGLRIQPGNTWAGTVKIDQVQVLNYPADKTLDITVQAADEVGANLTESTSAFAGTGWTSDGAGGWTATPGSTNPLDATLAGAPETVAAGEIVQFGLEVTGRTAGSVTVQVVGDTTASGQQTLATNNKFVDYVRAPVGPVTLRISRTSDFDGKVRAVKTRRVTIANAAPPAPTLFTVTGGSGSLDLKWEFPVVARRHTETAAIEVTGALDFSSQFGYRNTLPDQYGGLRFTDISCTAKRVGVSIVGSTSLNPQVPAADWVEIDGVVIMGGYSRLATSGRFQFGLAPGESGCWIPDVSIYNVFINLLDVPNGNNYDTSHPTVPGWNTDCIILNTPLNQPGAQQNPASPKDSEPYAFSCSAWIVNAELLYAGDGCIDNKHDLWANFVTGIGGNRTIRSHDIGLTRVLNSFLQKVPASGSDAATRSCLAAESGESPYLIWNTHIEGSLAQSAAELLAATLLEANLGDATLIAWVAKSWPYIPDAGRVAITDLEFETRPSGAGTWSTLNVPRVGLPAPAGAFHRTLTGIAAGTYDVRMRPRNGPNTGSWVTVSSVVVS